MYRVRITERTGKIYVMLGHDMTDSVATVVHSWHFPGHPVMLLRLTHRWMPLLPSFLQEIRLLYAFCKLACLRSCRQLNFNRLQLS